MLIELLPCLCLLQYLPTSLALEQKILENGGGKQPSPLDAKLAELVKDTLKEWHVPGLSIGVVDGDDMWAEVRGYGIATYPDTPVTPSTLFYGASTTKAFTAAGMSLLVTDQENFTSLTWKTPVSSLIPDDFVLEDAWATDHITIEDILSHRTGMPRHDLSYGGTYEGRNSTPRDVVRALRYLPMTEEPRVRFQYCNMMYVVAGHIIETLTGGSLEKFLKERIWQPLGMKSTSFSNSDAISGPDHFAQGYVYYKDKYLPVPYEDDLVTNAAAGSIISNVLDYSKWLHALLHRSSPIPKEAYEALFTPHMLHDSGDVPYTGPVAYALGWETSTYKGYQFFEHSGGVEAFGSHIIFFPELNYGLCAFGNTAVTSNVAELIAIWHLIDNKLGIPEKERFDWNAKFKRALKAKSSEYSNSIKTFYPKLPSPTLPPTLPLSNYSGTYFHSAYRNFTIYEKEDGVLHADRQDVSWKLAVDFEHVSGDYFMALVDSTVAPGFVFKQAAAAEFRVGSDGVARSLGMAVEPEMGVEGRVWFERV
ncbi:putative penicillin-binding protein [Leptodontidium sp. 2 PMI_412]|nr:putative penicillin-binding protein [Leptodontidium sp. 2 PMI_412]